MRRWSARQNKQRRGFLLGIFRIGGSSSLWSLTFSSIGTLTLFLTTSGVSCFFSCCLEPQTCYCCLILTFVVSHSFWGFLLVMINQVQHIRLKKYLFMCLGNSLFIRRLRLCFYRIFYELHRRVNQLRWVYQCNRRIGRECEFTLQFWIHGWVRFLGKGEKALEVIFEFIEVLSDYRLN